MNLFFWSVNIIYLLAITPAMAQAPMKLVIKDFQIAEPLTQLLSTQVLTQQFKEIAKGHSRKYQIVPSQTEIQEMMRSVYLRLLYVSGCQRVF